MNSNTSKVLDALLKMDKIIQLTKTGKTYYIVLEAYTDSTIHEVTGMKIFNHAKHVRENDWHGTFDDGRSYHIDYKPDRREVMITIM